MLSWEDLRLFHAAWTHGSLTRAAHALGLAQATMSRRLERLEADAGHTLFRRTRSGLVPTDAAQALWPHVETMAHAARQGAAGLQGFEAKPEGVVRLAAIPGLAVDVLPPVLPAFREQYPGITLHILSGNALTNMEAMEADIALRGVAPTRGNLVSRRVATVGIGIHAAPSYVAKLSGDEPLHALDWLQYGPELAHLRGTQFVNQILDGRPPVLMSNSFLTLRAAAQAGLGCFLLPDVQAAACGLVPVPMTLDPKPVASLYTVVPKPLQFVPRVRAVLGFLDGVWEDLT